MQHAERGQRWKAGRVLTIGLFKLLAEEFNRVLRAVDDERAHHVFEDLIETLLFDVFFAAALEVNFLLFQHHLDKSVFD